MDFNSFEENIAQFRDLFLEIGDSGAIEGVYRGVQWIGGIAIMSIFVINGVKILSSGGERPVKYFEDILKPLLLTLVLAHWLTIMSLINTASIGISGAISSVAKLEKSEANVTQLFADGQEKAGTYLYAKLILEQEEAEEGSIISLGSFYREMEFGFKTARIRAAGDLAGFAISVQNIVSIMFYAYAGLVLELLKIVGAIALVLSFFPNMQQSFFSWLKNFIAVNMWVAVAALIFYIVDLIYLKVLEINDIEVVGNVLVSKSQVTLEGDFDTMLTMLRRQAWIYLGFGVLKGVLMFKIPNIVSMFIGSSSSSGGMFAAVFSPVKMASGGAKSAVGGGGLSRLAGK